VTIAELKKAKDSRPFQPFTIEMADGRAIPVRHPDAIAWDEGSRRIAVCALPGGGAAVIDVTLATALVLAAPAEHAGANGGPAEGGAKGGGQ
jgi:hypothetical protein